MAGIGKQLRGSGIARPGFESKHEVSEKQEYRVGKAMGGKMSGMGSVGRSPRFGSFLRTMGEYKGLAKNPTLMAKGGKALKKVDKEKNPGLSKLPTEVRNKMGYMKKGGSANWIQGAIKHPGSLRKSLHVKESQKIPAKKLAAAAKKSGTLGRRARLAETLRSFKK